MAAFRDESLVYDYVLVDAPVSPADLERVGKREKERKRGEKGEREGRRKREKERKREEKIIGIHIPLQFYKNQGNSNTRTLPLPPPALSPTVSIIEG